MEDNGGCGCGCLFFILIIVGGLLFGFVTGGGGGYEEDDYYEDDPGVHWVDEYERSDGTEVDGHWRSNPDDSPYNNLNP
ncbi:hypothetical protein [Metabacillus fastidiosus]|uniref:Uncharacterized protein n=1 Tax=Metabacillus fastidiosus TaxID=1458 RepID=A0ABU6P2Z1_9BACI|nr:hypothetical protein [Metabacillus fastidiosus]